MKAALCFILNYDHKLIKEDIWRKWIDANEDIINVYFFYSDYEKIQSSWIKEHALPQKEIHETTYLQVLPAYLSLMRHAIRDQNNEWLIFLTDFCAPIVSPQRFRYMFTQYHTKSFLKHCPVWWDVEKNHRANLKLLPAQYHLANSPWFTLSRLDSQLMLKFINLEPVMAKKIFDGIVANESFFAIALEYFGVLTASKNHVISENTHVADWANMSSATSPRIFEFGNIYECNFIENQLTTNPYAMFIRKVGENFPDTTLERYIYSWQSDVDATLTVVPVCDAVVSGCGCNKYSGPLWDQLWNNKVRGGLFVVAWIILLFYLLS